MGGAFNNILWPVLMTMAVSSFGAGTILTSSGILPGGIQGQGATVIFDGMFGSSCDGVGSGDMNSLRGGAAGQLVEPVAIQASSPVAGVPETSSCRLSANSLNDDASYTDIEVAWAVVDGPIVAIDSNGTVWAGTVYQDSQAIVSASGAGLTGTAELMVLDTLKDNFGLYAGDGIADLWQVQNFGVNNTNGLAAADGDRDGADNYSEFITGTSPLNGGDVFRVTRIRRQGSGPAEVTLAPAFSNRVYHLDGCVNLRSPTWTRVASSSGPSEPSPLVISDMAATNSVMFYRASVDYAW